MVSVPEVLQQRCGAVVAPAGHGKTELITRVAAESRRALILTHTHAGVHAIRDRLKRHGVRPRDAAVDTIAGWCMKYAHAFPSISAAPVEMPRNSEEWNALYEGVGRLLAMPAVQQIVRASYDRVLVDEYQDCNDLQHEVATKLAAIVPTIVFGDPVQGIFEFAGATLSWENDVHPRFPLLGNLNIPYRWQEKNEDLGDWIAETRVRLLAGDPIDLHDPRIEVYPSDDAFDMSGFFENNDEKEGSFAAIHCRKGICYKLASAARGGYQAIEEIAARRLIEFSEAWDQALTGEARLSAIRSLLRECASKVDVSEEDTAKAELVDDEVRNEVRQLELWNYDQATLRIIELAKVHPGLKFSRRELWRDTERALREVVQGRAESLRSAADIVRNRTSIVGRVLPQRTVSTPLLLKGLEFDHVVLPNVRSFTHESNAQAKLFYVAVSRATRSLRVGSTQRYVQFPPPAV